jgi:ribosomal protein S18 acetylase RimI-like enzyme
MHRLTYREADESDIGAMAIIRAAEWETEVYWKTRIARYMARELHPQHALMPRIGYVAYDCESLVGFIAGHLTRRHACDGELEWINVIPEYRRSGVAGELLRLLAGWFVQQNALKVCIDVQPSNIAARKFYMRHGATDLNKHWLLWNDINVVLSEH